MKESFENLKPHVDESHEMLARINKLLNQKDFDAVKKEMDEIDMEETHDLILICYLVPTYWARNSLGESYSNFFHKLSEKLDNRNSSPDCLIGLEP